MRIGYYSGDPARLTADCAKLCPAIFPSVPRLYNKVYAKISSSMTSATGIKGWLVKKALAAKSANLQASGTFTHGCYDKLVFKKVR